MTTLKIEKNIPIPSHTTNRDRPFSSVFRIMEVGDSVLVVGNKHNNVTKYYYTITKTTGRKFITRKVEGGIRVWRIE